MISLDIQRVIETHETKHAAAYIDAVSDLYVATVTEDAPAAAKARKVMAEITAEAMQLVELFAAAEVMRDAADIVKRLDFTRRASFNFEASAFHYVTFEEAVEQLLERTPVTLRRAAERTAQRIAELYSEDNVIAFVRSAEASVTREAQDYIARAMKEGMGEAEAGRGLALRANEVRKRSRAWSEAYARMAFRTNVNTANTAGRFRQVQDPDIREVIPAFRFDAVVDSDVRDNHVVGDGMILSVTNPAWNKVAPPLGYNCRCHVALVSVVQLQQMGRLKNGKVVESRVPAGLVADPGFRHGGRPDLMMAGVQ